MFGILLLFMDEYYLAYGKITFCLSIHQMVEGLPWWLSDKESVYQCKELQV